MTDSARDQGTTGIVVMGSMVGSLSVGEAFDRVNDDQAELKDPK